MACKLPHIGQPKSAGSVLRLMVSVWVCFLTVVVGVMGGRGVVFISSGCPLPNWTTRRGGNSGNGMRSISKFQPRRVTLSIDPNQLRD